jgi:hypothetical protein
MPISPHYPPDFKTNYQQLLTDYRLPITDYRSPNHPTCLPKTTVRQVIQSLNHPITQSSNLPAEDDSQAGHPITQSPNHENNIINTASRQHTAFAAR